MFFSEQAIILHTYKKYFSFFLMYQKPSQIYKLFHFFLTYQTIHLYRKVTLDMSGDEGRANIGGKAPYSTLFVCIANASHQGLCNNVKLHTATSPKVN